MRWVTNLFVFNNLGSFEKDAFEVKITSFFLFPKIKMAGIDPQEQHLPPQ